VSHLVFSDTPFRLPFLVLPGEDLEGGEGSNKRCQHSV
jgi:hypothetical protein